MRRLVPALLVLLLPAHVLAQSKDANRLAYLDEVNPYYPSRTFPKLITPQWIGEPGVEAAVILAIDDMKEPKRYEAFLRPILRRLQKIDGRAPVSIMSCNVDPKDPQLQTWLKEALSIECHTFDHPCPFFKGGFDKAKGTYDKCVDLMHQIPNSKPVAFRMPCCDSLNTVSPRFFTEIFNKTTKKGNFLQIDSSVFNVFTSNDPDLPKALVQNADGSERFRNYLPKDRTYVNYIEDYPYPYVIGRLCWQFPCMTPSDWQAQHLHKPNNPQTVKDWQAALDCTVIKKGVFCLVFHPWGWIRNDQVVDLIDYAVAKYGKKVKFLNFREALERLNKNMMRGQTLRSLTHGSDNGVRLIDLDNDGYSDLVIGNNDIQRTCLWSSKTKTWSEITFPWRLTYFDGLHVLSGWTRFGIQRPDGFPYFLSHVGLDRKSFPPEFQLLEPAVGAQFNGTKWAKDRELLTGLKMDGKQIYSAILIKGDNGVRLRDLNGDGSCELIVRNSTQNAVFTWSKEKKTWSQLPFCLPHGAVLVDAKSMDSGFRFLDLDGDGKLDIIFSNEKEYGIYLFKDMTTGWSRKVMAGKRADKDALPMISRNGSNNGFWVHSGSLWWSNEDTVLLKDHVDRRSIKELLKGKKD
jgi:hypothetical protein